MYATFTIKQNSMKKTISERKSVTIQIRWTSKRSVCFFFFYKPPLCETSYRLHIPFYRSYKKKKPVEKITLIFLYKTFETQRTIPAQSDLGVH